LSTSSKMQWIPLGAQVNVYGLYKIEYPDYWLASTERLEGRVANNKLAKAKVYLIFLIQKSYKASKKDPIFIPEAFATLHTLVYSKPQKYNEV
jgi:hypothetical protein